MFLQNLVWKIIVSIGLWKGPCLLSTAVRRSASHCPCMKTRAFINYKNWEMGMWLCFKDEQIPLVLFLLCLFLHLSVPRHLVFIIGEFLLFYDRLIKQHTKKTLIPATLLQEACRLRNSTANQQIPSLNLTSTRNSLEWLPFAQPPPTHRQNVVNK